MAAAVGDAGWLPALALLVSACQTVPPPSPAPSPTPLAAAAATATTATPAAHRPGAGRRRGARLCPHRRDPGAGGSRHPARPGGRHLGRQPGGGAVCRRARAARNWPRWRSAWTSRRSPTGRSRAAALIRGEALARYVREHTGGRAIEQMKLPLGIVATDLDSGQPILFQRRRPRRGGARVERGAGGVPAGAGSATASMSTAAWCRRCRCALRGRWAPSWSSRSTSRARPTANATGDAMRMLLQTFAIMGRSINSFELRDADVVLRPKLAGVSAAPTSPRASVRSRPGARRRWPAWPNCARASQR